MAMHYKAERWPAKQNRKNKTLSVEPLFVPKDNPGEINLWWKGCVKQVSLKLGVKVKV